MKIARVLWVLRAWLLGVALIGSSRALVADPPQPSPAGPTRGSVDLRPKFRTGDEHRYQMSMTTKGDQHSSQGKVENRSKIDIGLLLKVRSADDNGARLELVYESFKLELRNPLLNVDFDSGKPADKQDPDGTDAILRSLVGMKLDVQADANGNITNISAPAGGGGVGLDLLSQFTAADIVKRFVGPITTLSSGPPTANVGDTWVNEDVMQGSMGPVRTKNTYKLVSYNAPEAKLDIDGTISMQTSASSPASVRDGTVKGNAVWDTRLGMLRSIEMKQKLLVDQTMGEEAGSSTQEVDLSVRRR
jgi:hypothetical protein